jgi:excisionase family DNA binding protein
MPDPVVVPKLLTMDELAERLGVTHRHVRRLVAERRVPFLKVGRFVRFDPAKISAWLDSNRVPGQRAEQPRAPKPGPATYISAGHWGVRK